MPKSASFHTSSRRGIFCGLMSRLYDPVLVQGGQVRGNRPHGLLIERFSGFFGRRVTAQ